jgi:uncharacterized OB-fold protein
MNDRPFNDHSYELFLQEGKIMGSKCKKCGALALPPRQICRSCFSDQMEWVPIKGDGKLVAFTGIVVAPPTMAKEGFSRDNPYIVGVVELKEGAKTVARLTGVDAKKPEKVKVGMSLRAEILQRGEEASRKAVLTFKP